MPVVRDYRAFRSVILEHANCQLAMLMFLYCPADENGPIGKIVISYLAAAMIAASACLVSCTAPEAVASFAAASNESLDQSRPIFNDLPESYARRFCAQVNLNRNFQDLASTSACVPPDETANYESFQEEAAGLNGVSTAWIEDIDETLESIRAM